MCECKLWRHIIRLKETQKIQSEDGVPSSSKPKMQRNTGIDTVAFLKEKMERDIGTREKELTIREKELGFQQQQRETVLEQQRNKLLYESYRYKASVSISILHKLEKLISPMFVHCLKSAKKIRKYSSSKAAKSVYQSMILPIITYGSLLHINRTKTQCKRLLSFHNC